MPLRDCFAEQGGCCAIRAGGKRHRPFRCFERKVCYDKDEKTDCGCVRACSGCRVLPLVTAEDITSQLLSDDEMKALVGKTTRELIESGMVFEGYSMYGGEQTGAYIAKGFFQYVATFNVSISDEDTEDEGASIMDAEVVEFELASFSDTALDPYSA